MRIEILDQAELDLIEGFHFYESQDAGLGSYFLTSLYSDIESLRLYAGVHGKAYSSYQRLLSRRFPFAVSTQSGKAPSSSTLSWIAAEIPPGFENVFYKARRFL
jgi:hypothetical protein